jgi:hypothetical protein
MRRFALAFLTAFSVIACKGQSAPPPQPSGAATIPPKPPEFSKISEEQRARKARSEARLRQEGVPISASLPVIADKREAKLRTKDVVVDRVIALALVAVKGEGIGQKDILALRDELGAAPFLSAAEKKFIDDPSPSQKDRVQFAWRYECLGVLHWALGFVEKLETPSKIVDAGTVVRLVRKPSPAQYRANAKLRTADEILDEADLIYRYDWACVDARVTGKPAPTAIDCEIVVERHRALNWLHGYEGQPWDDVSTDT